MNYDNHHNLKNLELIKHEEDFSDFMDAFESERNLTPSALDSLRKKRDKARARRGIKKHNLALPSKQEEFIRRVLSEYEKTDRSKRPITLPCLDRLYDIVGPECSQLIKNRLYHNND